MGTDFITINNLAGDCKGTLSGLGMVPKLHKLCPSLVEMAPYGPAFGQILGAVARVTKDWQPDIDSAEALIAQMNLLTLLLGVVDSITLVGIFFEYDPARQASRMRSIEALRSS